MAEMSNAQVALQAAANRTTRATPASDVLREAGRFLEWLQENSPVWDEEPHVIPPLPRSGVQDDPVPS